jgi:hypothetical protein
MVPNIAIIYNFNDNVVNFRGGSSGGVKSKISYFEQFLISYESINKNWNLTKFTYDFYVVHTNDFNKKNKSIIDSINVKTIKVQNPIGETGLRCMTFMVDIDCDFRLILDNDTIALQSPNFDFTKDILVSYGGGIYTKELYVKFCNFIGVKLPNEQPIENITQSFGSAEYEYMYKSNNNTRLFPALNAGALLIKNKLSTQFGKRVLEATKKIPDFAKNNGGYDLPTIQPVYGLVVNHITNNWYHFEKGFNLLLSEFNGLSDIYQKYNGPKYLLHYINYPINTDPLSLNIPKHHQQILRKYYGV